MKAVLIIFVLLGVGLAGLFIAGVFDGGNETSVQPGVLEGKATVGPICPVEREGVPCPVPPEAYTSREAIVYKKDGETVVARAHFDATGRYRFELAPGTYIVDIAKNGVDSSSDVPRKIVIRSGETMGLNIDIDTGIR